MQSLMGIKHHPIIDFFHLLASSGKLSALQPTHIERTTKKSFELKIEQRELELESLQIKYDERITAKQVEVK